MIVPKSLADIQRLVTDGVEENINLDYKAAAALQPDKKKEIAKDVSAMANSAGGVIIYGIKEFDEESRRHLPELIDPVTRSQFSKETLEQIINSNISPKIGGLQIHPIPTDALNVVYVVEIPQSNTAHQNTKDFKYYKRYNFESVAMLDHEIRDILNRQTHPIVNLDFEMHKQILIPASVKYQKLKEKQNPGIKLKISKRQFEKFTLRFRPRNDGLLYARYVNYFITMPLPIAVYEEEFPFTILTDSNQLKYAGDNTHRDIVGEYFDPNGPGENKYGPSRFQPILPGLTGKIETIDLVDDLVLDDRVITWSVHADNAPPNSGSIRLDEIPVIVIRDERAKDELSGEDGEDDS